MSALATVYALFPGEAEARAVGRAVVERRLAACVNILAPCTSIYRWEGRIEEGTEVPALFKTAAAQTEALIAAIVAAHPYAVPAVTAWPVAAAPTDYTAWIVAETAAVS